METIVAFVFTALIVVAFMVWMSRERAFLVQVLTQQAPTPERPITDLENVLATVLDRFVEQSKSTNETITGVYTAPMPAPQPVTEFLDAPRTATILDFDDSDPTDAYLLPARSNGAVLDPGDDSPFGIPGLVIEARKDAPLTVADILGTGVRR